MTTPVRFALATLALGAALLLPWQSATARSLELIQRRGAIELCVHPNALPFSHKRGAMHGFQVELGEAIAKQLGVDLETDWVIGGHQIRRVGCDMVLDAIADPEAQGETGLKLSKPYYRTGVVIAVLGDSPFRAMRDLGQAKIGVIGSSVASMTLNTHGFATSSFAFEDDILQALAEGAIGAAAVGRNAAGYYNMLHPEHTLRTIGIDAMAPGLSWNVAVGLAKPDAKLLAAIDGALAQLAADGSLQRIYGRYGITLLPPR